MASPAHPDIPSALLARFEQAAKELTARTGPLPPDWDESIRKWLDGEDEPLAWQNSSGITPDEYFFITTLYGNMNSAGQRTMIRKFFEPLFVQAAKRDIRGFFPETPGYAGLRAPYMKARLCKMGGILRGRGMSMTEYVQELRSLQSNATSQTPALDRIIHDHEATSWKTLSVFVRDCARVNCFPIDLRVRRQLEKYQLPDDEGRLVRMCLALNQNPREVARIFYEADLGEKNHLDLLVNLDEPEPCVFYTWEGEGEGWLREPCGKLTRRQDTLSFNVLDEEGSWVPEKLTLQKDGLHHWRESGGPGHWWGFLSETETRTYLACNYINPDGHKGFQIFVWPK